MTKITGIMYHYVREIQTSDYPQIKGLEFKEFQKQLDQLEKNYNFVTCEEIIDFFLNDKSLPNNPCWLTFDDGYRDHYDYVMPELLKRGIQGSFFPVAEPSINRKLLDVNAIHFILAKNTNIKELITRLKEYSIDYGLDEAEWSRLYELNAVPNRFDNKDVIFFKRMLQRELPKVIRSEITKYLFEEFVGFSEQDFAEKLYMSKDDISDLIAKGMYVGSHTHTHLWLNSISKDEQVIEIDKSLEFLSSVGAPTTDWVMCYPYGGYNEDTIDILRDKKCAIAVTAIPGDITKTSSRYELPRYDTNDFL